MTLPGMNDEPDKRSWGWIGALLALFAVSFGGLLILAAFDFCNDTPLSELPHHIFIFPGLGVANGAVLVGLCLARDCCWSCLG
jgi:hypothetical protein